MKSQTRIAPATRDGLFVKMLRRSSHCLIALCLLPALSTDCLAIGGPPVITTQPQSQTRAAGSSVTFTVVVSSVTFPTYKWKFNGTNIVGATHSSYTISNVYANHAGTYSVGITNAVGGVVSSNAVLTVNSATLVVAHLGTGNVIVSPETNYYVVGQQVILNATPGRYYTFVRWSDNNTSSNRIVTLGSSNYFTAIFTNAVPLEELVFKQWDRSFGGTNNEELTSMQQTADGNYILGGWSTSGVSGNKETANFGSLDYWMIKTDANGAKLWERTFGGTGVDIMQSLQQTRDGGYIVGGASTSGVSGNRTNSGFGSDDFWVLKLDGNGNKQWERAFGGSQTDHLSSLQQTSDGGYILAGHSNSPQNGSKTAPNYGGADFWVIKLDSTGAAQWDRTFGGSTDDFGAVVRQTTDGGYIIGGNSESYPDGNKTSPAYGEADFWVVRLDAAGNKIWDHSFGGYVRDVLLAISITQDGGFLLGGYSRSGASGNKTSPAFGATDFWIVRLNSNGDKVAEQSFGGTLFDELTDIQPLADGGFMLAGYSDSQPGGSKTSTNYGGFDFWVLRQDAYHNVRWEQSFGGGTNEWLNDICMTSDGGFLLGGRSNSSQSGNKASTNFGLADFWVVKAVTRDAPVGTPVVLVNGLYSVSNSFLFPASSVVQLTLKTTFASGSVFYTLDGSVPSTNSLLYTTNVLLYASATVRAVAYSANRQTSAVADPVDILIGAPSLPRLTALGYTGSGFQLQLTGQPGTYVIEISTNFSSWLGVLTTNIPAAGFLNLLDATALNTSQRFYRAYRP